jgi:hypothetical protein
MTDHRWTSLFKTVLVLALFAVLPAAAPASPPLAEPDLTASYAAIFSPDPVSQAEGVAESATGTGFALVYCCSATYCCEAMMSSECDGTRFSSAFNCATRCSLC